MTEKSHSILYSPSEPMEIKEKLEEMNGVATPYCEENGSDFILFTERGIVCLQRKRFPDDFLASVNDGRLAKECSLMRQATQFRVIVVEGRIWDNRLYTQDGRLILNRRPSRWSRSGIRNLLRSLRYIEGVDVEITDDMDDTVQCLIEIQNYFDTEHHLSMRIRPKFESNWFVPTHEEKTIFFYQGLPGISIIRAKELAKEFPNPISLFNASIEELKQASRIGPKLATGIHNFLRGVLK